MYKFSIQMPNRLRRVFALTGIGALLGAFFCQNFSDRVNQKQLKYEVIASDLTSLMDMRDNHRLVVNILWLA